MLPFQFAKQHKVLALKKDEQIIIQHTEMLTQPLLSELYRHFQSSFIFKKISADTFQTLLESSYGEHQNNNDISDSINATLNLRDDFKEETDLLEHSNEAPIIRFINTLFSQAIQQNASDIHIESFKDSMNIRFRIDGILQAVPAPQKQAASLLTSRIKIMAKLDIAEKRLPQDGRITLMLAGRPIDVRVSTLPANHSERIVLRLLDKRKTKLHLSELGLSNKHLKQTRALIKKPQGIILITGPTGSGKTTSLYAALSELNKTVHNILTIEDPIEYDLAGIGQTQVNPKIDMTFAKGLRSILRQDPDIIMIGEIRDTETANIAVQASLTGHLVLSTLHTNSAVSAITRLNDLGVPSFLLSSSLMAVIAQRLVRLLCPACKLPKKASPLDYKRLGINETTPLTLYEAAGCDSCHHSGYKGRTGIHELVTVDDPLRLMIHDNASESTIKDYCHAQNVTINQMGFQHVIEGLTSLNEVLRLNL